MEFLVIESHVKGKPESLFYTKLYIHPGSQSICWLDDEKKAIKYTREILKHRSLDIAIRALH